MVAQGDLFLGMSLQGTGAVDLTGAKLFLRTPALHKRLTDLVRRLAPHTRVPCQGRELFWHTTFLLLLTHLEKMYKLWVEPKWLTPEQVTAYNSLVQKFAECWVALGWKPTLWVHWVCAHSGFVMGAYRTWYGFTSVPTEQRHKRFKRDLANTCQSWKYLNPGRCKGYLQRCIELDALDLGLRVLDEKPHCPPETIFPPVR